MASGLMVQNHIINYYLLIAFGLLAFRKFFDILGKVVR
jgi:hypothetical protein